MGKNLKFFLILTKLTRKSAFRRQNRFSILRHKPCLFFPRSAAGRAERKPSAAGFPNQTKPGRSDDVAALAAFLLRHGLGLDQFRNWLVQVLGAGFAGLPFHEERMPCRGLKSRRGVVAALCERQCPW